MKIVKKGNSRSVWVGKTVTCPNCECQFKLEQGDSVNLVPDQRDGDYYEVKCPGCSANVTMDATLFRKSGVVS